EKRGRLTMEEFELAKLHVNYSAEILRATPGLPADLARAAALHHERHDGSGYPKGLRGHEIGMIGSIAAIVDTFDALTVKRPYADAVSPSAAISMLYKWRGVFYDAHLVEQFIRCIGIFPVGSLVELNTGEAGRALPDPRRARTGRGAVRRRRALRPREIIRIQGRN